MPRWFRYCVGSLICIAAVLLFLVAAAAPIPFSLTSGFPSFWSATFLPR